MISAFVFLVLVALSRAGVPRPEGRSGRIVHGEIVGIGEIPYQVSLQDGSNFHYCGGSIISKDYVITAASCTTYTSIGDVQIIAGSVNLDDPKSIHRAGVIIVHEQYNESNSWDNNIALIKVDPPFVVSGTLDCVSLPESGEDVAAESVAVISGWGWLSTAGPITRELQRKNVLITAQSKCSEIWKDVGWTIRDTHICAQNPNLTTGPCIGDSGTPLTAGNKLVGVTFRDIECGSHNYPIAYTRVSKYIDWIRANAV